MNTANPIPNDPPPEIGAGLAQLGLVFGIATAVIGCGAALIWDTSTALVAVVSGIVCLLAAIAAFFLGIYPRGEFFRLTRLYTASAIRIAIPVVYLFVCKTFFPDQFGQGMVYFVVLFYLVGLLTDLVLQLRRNRQLYAQKSGTLGQPANGDS